MKPQKTLNSQSNTEDKEQIRGIILPNFKLLQSYHRKNTMVLIQK